MKRNRGPQTGKKGQTRSYGERIQPADGPSHKESDLGSKEGNQTVPGRHQVNLVPADCNQFDQYTGMGTGGDGSDGDGGIGY